MTVDAQALADALGIPVVSTVATGGEGIAQLTRNLADALALQPLLHYDVTSEAAIADLTARIAAHAPRPRLATRGLAILYLG